jgi:DNA-binding response OmpR family regulator
MRVLLVEDTDDLRHLFARVLKARGFEVRAAADGREALACLAEFVPDVVVTDLMMPGLNGVELIRRLRAMPAMVNIPIVAMTAAATAEAVREVHQAGVGDLLTKPLDFQTLFDRIGGLCRFSRPNPQGMPSPC